PWGVPPPSAEEFPLVGSLFFGRCFVGRRSTGRGSGLVGRILGGLERGPLTLFGGPVVLADELENRPRAGVSEPRGGELDYPGVAPGPVDKAGGDLLDEYLRRFL